MKLLLFCFLLTSTQAWSQFEIRAQLHSFDEAGTSKIKEAINIIKNVVKSERFRQEILNYQYKDKFQFKDNIGLSNQEILTKIFDASETLTPEKNGVMDLELELIYEDSRTIGYTYPDIKRIYINRKFFDQFTPYQVADNLFHEWLHKIGFDHDHQFNHDRIHSVPYAIGYMIERIAFDLMQTTEERHLVDNQASEENSQSKKHL